MVYISIYKYIHLHRHVFKDDLMALAVKDCIPKFQTNADYRVIYHFLLRRFREICDIKNTKMLGAFPSFP